MPSSGDGSSRRCFSAVLSRLLCSGSLPTHPSEQLAVGDDSKAEKSSVGNNVEQVGVVARLMGLEPFPSAPRERTLGDYFRSKSVNSIDFLSHFDLKNGGHHRHRRVRTSVSFRDSDFTSIVLRLDEEERGNGESFRGRKGVDGESFQGRKEKAEYNRPGKNLEMEEKRKPVHRKICPGNGNLAAQGKNFQGKTRRDEIDDLQWKRKGNLKERRPVIKRENCMESRCGRKREKKILARKVQCRNKIHPEGSVPEVPRRPGPRKQPPAQTATSLSPHPSPANSDNTKVGAIITGKDERRKMRITESCYYKRMMEDMCMLTEEDASENWIHGMVLRFEDVEEMCLQFEQNILEALLGQFVSELVVVLVQ